jgi:NTP pyrophosphatase (non-canonical NTP hydrolase)
MPLGNDDIQKVRVGSKEFLILKLNSDMERTQEKIKIFSEERKWKGAFDDPKDYLLGIVEEVGEVRNIVKWINDREIIDRTIKENFDKVEDMIGDLLWFTFMLANRVGVNTKEAIEKVIEKNIQRFPVELTKGKHTNVYAGGIDLDRGKSS